MPHRSFIVNIVCPVHILCFALFKIYFFSRQVQKILSMYSPADDYEERVPSSLIRLVAEMCEADQVDPNNIMVDVHRFYPIEISYVSCDVSFPTLKIPLNLLGKHMTVM